MDRSNVQHWKRLGAIGAAAIILILLIVGGGSLDESGQEVARPLATIASAGDIPIVIGDSNTSAATPTRAGPQEIDGLRVIYLDQLPPEGRATLQLIEAGGPFPYDRDGLTFQNRERILPSRPRGYYREYTVITPGEDDRGARRIVAGEEGEMYYTDDHYDSFSRIMER